METLLKITGVIAALVIPIVLCILNNRIAKIKHSREHQAELLKLAADFENGIENKSILYRDRMAKHLFNNEYLTYEEAKFFSVYENADVWVQEYAKVRGLLKRERNENGGIIKFKPKYNAIKIILAFIGYFIFCCISLVPFIIIHKYISLIEYYSEKGVLLISIGFIVIPMLCFYLAYFCLNYAQKCAECGIFLHDFENEAFKQVESRVENT
ncbi:hypothetical protein [Acinetobacter proteolyticus]|uniref:Uncharacterized protein n=1 Tax=Acinetobacter proteolyticus TaxID=1776741 RepID=A0A2N0WEZ7_9GAMM|nr:hypothetical protein [Acinetobacter proteolyticus]PKF33444.1 hypothetical protein CW311_11635 [Acinetobacter proteolyticus]